MKLIPLLLVVMFGSCSLADELGPANRTQEISNFARPSDTGRYAGYTVGGGATSRRQGEPPTAAEGTWGWDYQGGFFKRRVIPGWWHGRRTQGGVGAYAPDGPTLLPALER